MRHNEMRNLEAQLLSEVCKDVTIEPVLLPINTETFEMRSTITSNEARLDISARGVWNPMDKTYFDIRVFHPGADSNKALDKRSVYRKHENEKKRAYNSRVLEVGKGTFTPLVFSTSGGMGDEATAFNKRLALLLSDKKGNTYSDTISFIRRRLRFCILKTTLVAIRGFRGKKATDPLPIDRMDFNLIPHESPFL